MNCARVRVATVHVANENASTDHRVHEHTRPAPFSHSPKCSASHPTPLPSHAAVNYLPQLACIQATHCWVPHRALLLPLLTPQQLSPQRPTQLIHTGGQASFFLKGVVASTSFRHIDKHTPARSALRMSSRHARILCPKGPFIHPIMDTSGMCAPVLRPLKAQWHMFNQALCHAHSQRWKSMQWWLPTT
jgi:hypothetical protein